MNPADHIAIQTLLYRYCDFIDRGDLASMAQMFAHAIVHMPAAPEPFVNDPAGILAINRQYVRLYDDGTPRTRHVVSNIIIEADGPDQARAQSTVVVYQATDALPLQPVIAGSYYDRFARVGSAWRFSERRMDMPLFGNLSAHMKVAFGPGA